MKKYAIWSPARTGSTLYANLLNYYYNDYCQVDYEHNNIFWDVGNSMTIKQIRRLSEPILHLHNLDIFEHIDLNYVKIITTRSIIDSAISRMIAEITGQWHLKNKEERKKYYLAFRGQTYNLDVDRFINYCSNIDYNYVLANNICNNFSSTHYQIDYISGTRDFNEIFRILNLDFTIIDPILFDRFDKSTKKIDKFLLVKNLNEIVDAYKSLKLRHNFNDSITLKHIKRTYFKK